MYNFIIFWKLHYDAVCGDMLKLTFHSFVANVDCIQNQDVTEVNMLFLENVCSMCVCGVHVLKGWISGFCWLTSRIYTWVPAACHVYMRGMQTSWPTRASLVSRYIL